MYKNCGSSLPGARRNTGFPTIPFSGIHFIYLFESNTGIRSSTLSLGLRGWDIPQGTPAFPYRHAIYIFYSRYLLGLLLGQAHSSILLTWQKGSKSDGEHTLWNQHRVINLLGIIQKPSLIAPFWYNISYHRMVYYGYICKAEVAIERKPKNWEEYQPNSPYGWVCSNQIHWLPLGLTPRLRIQAVLALFNNVPDPSRALQQKFFVYYDSRSSEDTCCVGLSGMYGVIAPIISNHTIFPLCTEYIRLRTQSTVFLGTKSAQLYLATWG